MIKNTTPNFQQQLRDEVEVILRESIEQGMMRINELFTKSTKQGSAEVTGNVPKSLLSGDSASSPLVQNILPENLKGPILPCVQNVPLKDLTCRDDPSEVLPVAENACFQSEMDLPAGKFCSEGRPEKDATGHSRSSQTLNIYRKTSDIDRFVKSHSVIALLGETCSTRFRRCSSLFQLKEPSRTGHLAHFLSSKRFQTGMLIVIIVNTIFTLHETNEQMRSVQTGQSSSAASGTSRIAEVIFTGVYVLELMLKFTVHRCFLFYNDEMWWNLFDCVVVAVGMFELLLMYGSGVQARYSPQFLRSLRIVKVLKIFRAIRVVQFVKELRLMLACVVGSIVSLIWSFTLLAGLSLMFAAVMVQQMGVAVSESIITVDQLPIVFKRFGTVQQALLTLFQCISGGENWGLIYDVTKEVGWLNAACFLLYVLFVWLSLTNIITAIFVDKALQKARPGADDLILQKHQQDLESISQLQEMFRSIDEDGSNTLTLAELQESFRNFRILSFFELQGLDVKDVEMFFSLLSQISNSDEIDMEDFVSGCLRMKGYATNIDVFSILFQSKAMGDKMIHAISQCNAEVQQLRSQLACVAGKTSVL